MKLIIKIVNRIADCNDDWDGFLPEQHHLRAKHLSAFENSKMEDLENYYVTVFFKDKIIGLVYLQEFQFQHKHLSFNSNQQFLSKIIKLILPAHLPILVCGHLFRINFPGFYFKNPSDNALIFEVMRLFTNEHKVCKARAMMVKDCNEPFLEEGCRPFGYRFFTGDVTMELTRRRHWNYFDDYLSDLNKKYVQRARKIIRSFEGIEKRELNAEEIFAHSAEINRLYLNVVNRQTIKVGIVNAQYIVELKKDLEEKFEFYALYKNKVMIGFYTFIFNSRDMESHFIGLDYQANKIHHTYFNILFLSAQKMIEQKLDKLELGRTAREAKANLGALPRQVFNYVNVRNPVVKLALNHFQKSFNKKENRNVIHRRPLK